MVYVIAGKSTGRIGFGMMGLTMPGTAPPTEDAIATLKSALEMGANLWNGSEHYGTPGYNSLHLLKAYFTKYPEDVDKVVVTMKTGFNLATKRPEVDAASIKAAIEHCLAVADGKYRFDVLLPGRLDPKVPVEETVGAFVEYVKAGKIGGVGLSEVSGASIRKAIKVTPISAVEVELSLFETGIYRNGVTDACGEFGIPILAYSPLGRGLLTGQWKTYDDIPDSNLRKRILPRFQREAFEENIKLVHEIESVAKRNGGSSVMQVALAWVSAQSEKVGAPVVAIPGASSMKRVRENMKPVELPDADVREIDDFLQRFEVIGGRAPAGMDEFMEV